MRRCSQASCNDRPSLRGNALRWPCAQRFCLFCRDPPAASGLTVANPSQASIFRSARRNGWRLPSSHRNRAISTCCPSLASHVSRPPPKPVHVVFLRVSSRGLLPSRGIRRNIRSSLDSGRRPVTPARAPVIAPQPVGFNAPGIAVLI